MNTKYDAVDILSLNHQLEKNDLFRNSSISSSDFDDLKLNIITLKKGEILFRQGDATNSIYLIIEGEINLIKKQIFGKTHSCLSKNNFFGHEEYFLQSDRNSIAIALQDSRIAELSKDNVETFLSRDNSILNNIKNSFLDLDSTSISKFENIIRELPDYVEKSSSVFSMAPKSINDENLPSGSNTKVEFTAHSNEGVYDKIDLNKLKSEINIIFNKLNENLLLLADEKDKMRAVIEDYESDNKKLQNDIEKLKEQENRFISLDKEKTEILGSQSYRIIELEKETAKFEQLESGFLKKIEILNVLVSKDKTRIKKLEADLKEKETTLFKLDNDFKENKKILASLNETHLIVAQKVDDQERVIKEQKTELKNSEERVERLSLELSTNEGILAKLNKDLQNKSKIISAHIDTANKTKADLERTLKALETKDEVIQNQVAKNSELLNKLEYQKESEKNRNEYILNQAHKIAEYEDILRNNKDELTHKDEIINNFIQETKEHTDRVLQKQSQIDDQSKIIVGLNDEINILKKSAEDLISRENDFKKSVADLTFHLSKANSKLVTSSEEVEEKIQLVEIKEKENRVIQKNLEELKNALIEKNNKINDLDNIITQLENELLESNRLKEEFNSQKMDFVAKTDVYNELKNENSKLSEQIRTLELQIEENNNESSKLLCLNDELNKLKSEFDFKTNGFDELKNENNNLSAQIIALKLQIEENKDESNKLLSLNDELNRLKSELDSNTKAYNELKNENSVLSKQINTLKYRIEESKSESNKLLSANYELNKLKSEFDSITKAYNELKKENSFLTEKVKTFRLRIEKSKDENSNLISLNTELSRLKLEEEKYKFSIIEKDRIIEEQKEQIENIRLAKNEAFKTIASTKGSFAEEIRKKDNQISELVDKLGQIQNTLDEKIFFENQQTETIDNQAQKIAELEVLVNESKVKRNNQTAIKEENVVKTDSPQTKSVEPVQLNPDEEILSKCKVIPSRLAQSISDNSFEHLEYFGVHIVNVNLIRASMDAAPAFNEFFQEIISRENNKILVDLSICEFIDSSVLGVLVKNLKKVTALGGDLKLVGFHWAVKSMMELTRMNKLFEFYPTIETAIRSFD